MPINFGLLDTSAPYKVATSFNEGMDNALMRQIRQMDVSKAQREFDAESSFSNALRSGGDMNALFAANPQMAYQYSNAQAQQQNALTAQENARRKDQESILKRKQSKDEAELGRIMANSLLGSQTYKVVDNGDGFEIAPDEAMVQNASYTQPVSEIGTVGTIEQRAAMFGLGKDEMDFIGVLSQADPKAANKLLGQIVMQNVRSRSKGAPEARDAIAKERAMAAEMNMPLGEYLKQKTAKSGVNITMNTGEKGFKNEMALRSDFKSEPMYKAYQQVDSAYRQINTSLGMASPAGDMAAATKIMKLLDPDSVVRESELAMAIQANGLMDRVTSYAERILTGQKLTPEQRKDFAHLADGLFNEAQNTYNNKRAEYESIATEYGLDPGRALGPKAAKPILGKPSIQRKSGTVPPKGSDVRSRADAILGM